MPESSVDEEDNNIVAPISGKVSKVLVKDGDEVKAGTVAIIVEAMKMENNLVVDVDSVVKKVEVKEGEIIQDGQILIEFS